MIKLRWFSDKTLTVSELIEELKKYPPHSPVIIEEHDCTSAVGSVSLLKNYTEGDSGHDVDVICINRLEEHDHNK